MSKAWSSGTLMAGVEAIANQKSFLMGMSDDDLERELAAPQKQFGVRCPYKCLGNEETFRDTNMKS